MQILNNIDTTDWTIKITMTIQYEDNIYTWKIAIDQVDKQYEIWNLLDVMSLLCSYSWSRGNDMR